MTPNQWARVTSLFDCGEELSEPQREELLSRECSDDHAVERQVRQLWRDLEKAEGFLESPIVSLSTPLDPLEAPMLEIGQRLAGRFTVLGLIGAGGMGQVYRAQDERLHRIVAVKVVSERFGEDYLRGLEREGRAVSSLTHPRISAMHDIGLDGQYLFLVMEHLTGETLAARIARGSIPMPEVLSVVCQITDGLEYAHRKGIIHCDLKPGNIFMTETGVKILDFGIARHVRRAETSAGVITASIESQPMGTAAYMSPEQALGRELDARSDLFSLGVILYEMTTGRRPFTGTMATEIIDKILHEAPEPIRSSRSDAKLLQPIVSRCLEKNKQRRYGSADELEEDLRRVAQGLAGTARPDAEVRSRLRQTRHENAPAIPTRQRELPRVRWTPKPLIERILALVFMVIAAVWVLRTGEARPTARAPASSATLPFKTVADDSQADLDGPELPGLRDQVARGVVGRLNGTAVPRLSTYAPGTNAYNAVLRGRYHLHRRTGDDVKKALAEFEKAARMEPAYPEAYAGLAVAWFLAENYIPVPSAEAMPKAKAAAMRALSLDETLSEPHAVLANVFYMWEWNWEAAGTAFRRAIGLEPGDALVRHWYADYLLALGRFDECLRERQAAEELDPVSPMVQTAHGITLEYMGRFPEAIRQLEQVLELEPHFLPAYTFLARAHAFNGDAERALRTLERARSIFGEVDSISWGTAKTLAIAGRKRESREIMTELVRTEGRQPLRMAQVHIALGEHSKAIDLIEESIRERRATVVLLGVRTDYIPLRNNQRFQALLRRINLR